MLSHSCATVWSVLISICTVPSPSAGSELQTQLSYVMVGRTSPTYCHYLPGFKAAFTLTRVTVTGYSYDFHSYECSIHGHSYKQTVVNLVAIKNLVQIVKYLEFHSWLPVTLLTGPSVE